MTSHEIGILARDAARWTQTRAEPVALYWNRQSQRVHKRAASALDDRAQRHLVGVYSLGATSEQIADDIRAFLAERKVAA